MSDFETFIHKIAKKADDKALLYPELSDPQRIEYVLQELMLVVSLLCKYPKSELEFDADNDNELITIKHRGIDVLGSSSGKTPGFEPGSESSNLSPSTK